MLPRSFSRDKGSANEFLSISVNVCVRNVTRDNLFGSTDSRTCCYLDSLHALWDSAHGTSGICMTFVESDIFICRIKHNANRLLLIVGMKTIYIIRIICES